MVRGSTDSIDPPPAMRAIADAVAARERRVATLQHALDGFAVVEAHRVVPAPAGGDEAAFENPRPGPYRRRDARHAMAASVLAAQMQSFSVTPPALCVDQATTQRS